MGWVLLALIGAQGVIGYAQYFSGLPAGLVWVHVSDAVLIWIVAIRLLFALRDRGVPALGRAVAADALAADAAVTLAAEGTAVNGREAAAAGIADTAPVPVQPGEQRSG
jgi:hypothetical protein